MGHLKAESGKEALPAGIRGKANDPVEHRAPDETLHKAVRQAQQGHRHCKRPLQQHTGVVL